MGPAVALKAVAGRRFSLTLFGASQVMMDIEPLVRMIRRDAVLHGATHTYVGATVIGVACALLLRPVCEWAIDLVSKSGSFVGLAPSDSRCTITHGCAMISALVGTYSHVLLDSVMHADMHPLSPLSDRNALLGAVSLGALHLACVTGFLVGAAGLFVSNLIRSMRSKEAPASRGQAPVRPKQPSSKKV
jgi:hypothetical protein